MKFYLQILFPCSFSCILKYLIQPWIIFPLLSTLLSFHKIAIFSLLKILYMCLFVCSFFWFMSKVILEGVFLQVVKRIFFYTEINFHSPWGYFPWSLIPEGEQCTCPLFCPNRKCLWVPYIFPLWYSQLQPNFSPAPAGVEEAWISISTFRETYESALRHNVGGRG